MESTFPALLLAHASRRPDQTAIREKDYGIWQEYTWAQLLQKVREAAAGLHLAGLRRGDRIVVISSNRRSVYVVMLASQALGAIPIALYQDAVAEEYVFPLQAAEVRHAFVENQEQVDKLLEIRDRYAGLSRIWVEDSRGMRKYTDSMLASYQSLLQSGAEHLQTAPEFLDAEVAATTADEIAAIFFTSGTTGVPKGVVHSHRTLIDRARAGAVVEKLSEQEEVLSYLPPAWIGQNFFGYAQWLVCGYVVNCPESADTVPIDLKEVGPTYYFAPPRVFSGLQTSIY